MSRLSNFYTRIEDHDKAIDYYMKANKELDRMKDKNVPYQRCIDFNSLGNLFANKKNHDIAISYFERSIHMADSLKFAYLKNSRFTSASSINIYELISRKKLSIISIHLLAKYEKITWPGIGLSAR